MPDQRRRQPVRARLVHATQRIGIYQQLRWLRHIAQPAMRRELRDQRALSFLLAMTLAQGSDAIDVGAHRGDALRDIVRLAPQGRHVAYEPLPELAARLRVDFPAAEVREAALWDQPGESSFVRVVSSPAMSGLRRQDYPGEQQLERITVRTERLDDALAEGFAPAFVKIDVEGAELQELRGGMEALARHRPVIVFEHGHGAAEHYGTTSAAIHDVLVGELGMRIFDLAGVGPYSRDHFQQMFTEPVWNWVAHA